VGKLLMMIDAFATGPAASVTNSATPKTNPVLLVLKKHFLFSME
jgi:hypothetical protein